MRKLIRSLCNCFVSSVVSELANGRMHSSVTGFWVRVSVLEIGGVSVAYSAIGGCELLGSRKGVRLLEIVEPRASVQSVLFLGDLFVNCANCIHVIPGASSFCEVDGQYTYLSMCHMGGFEALYRKNECIGKVRHTDNPNQSILVFDAASPDRALVAAVLIHSAESIEQGLAFRVGRIFRFDGGLDLEEQELADGRRHDGLWIGNSREGGMKASETVLMSR